MRATRRKWLRATASMFGFGALGLFGVYAAAQNERVIGVKAKKFSFTPDKITLKKDEPVLFELSTEDVLMGFSVHDLGVRADIVPGKIVQLRVTPQKTGEFEFSCDIFCGDYHEDMQGTITVV
jgi:cytochrome c oxidase subunit 2